MGGAIYFVIVNFLIIPHSAGDLYRLDLANAVNRYCLPSGVDRKSPPMEDRVRYHIQSAKYLQENHPSFPEQVDKCSSGQVRTGDQIQGDLAACAPYH